MTSRQTNAPPGPEVLADRAILLLQTVGPLTLTQISRGLDVRRVLALSVVQELLEGPTPTATFTPGAPRTYAARPQVSGFSEPPSP